MIKICVKNWQKGEGAPLDLEGEIPEVLGWKAHPVGLPDETCKFSICIEAERVVLSHTAQVIAQSFVADFPCLLWEGRTYGLMTDGASIVVQISNDDALQLMMKWFYSQEERYCPSILTRTQAQERTTSVLSLNAERCLLEKNRWGNWVPVNERRRFFLREILFHFNPYSLSITAQ